MDDGEKEIIIENEQKNNKENENDKIEENDID